MSDRPAEATHRHAVVKVYVQVEDWDAPGYFVDITSDPVTVDTPASKTSIEDFTAEVGDAAFAVAQNLTRRLYDKSDPVYGNAEARARGGY